MGQQVNVGRELRFAPGATISGMPGMGEGRTYYVNNITGSDAASGLSWNEPMKEPSYAIAASETYRALGGRKSNVSTNDYIRNTIVIQGTGTAYTYITALPLYCDIIGLGADPHGLGEGIARISGDGSHDACDTAVTIRGLNLYNLQFTQSAAGASYGLDISGAMYRSRIERCGFTNNTTAGIHIHKAGSLVIDDCNTVQDQYNSTYGMHIDLTTGGFNACKITNSYFHGTEAGVYSQTNNAGDTWWNNCMFMGGTYGFRDTGAGAASINFYFVVTNCYAYGTTSGSYGTGGFVVTSSPTTRYFDCIDNSDGTTFRYPHITADT